MSLCARSTVARGELQSKVFDRLAVGELTIFRLLRTTVGPATITKNSEAVYPGYPPTDATA
jgi:hypothetical protein